MKNALFTFLQFLLFYGLFAAGIVVGLFDPMHLKWFVTQLGPGSTRYFVPDGLLMAIGLYVLILLIEAARKRIRQAGPWTTLAFVLALALGLASKFGMVTHNLN